MFHGWVIGAKDHVRLSGVVKKAVDSRRLVKPVACQGCGKTNTLLNGHHEDYSKPLDIIWFCTSCHKRRHIHAAATLEEFKSILARKIALDNFRMPF